MRKKRTGVTFSFYLEETDVQIIEAVREQFGMSGSALIRFLLRKEFGRLLEDGRVAAHPTLSSFLQNKE